MNEVSRHGKSEPVTSGGLGRLRLDSESRIRPGNHSITREVRVGPGARKLAAQVPARDVTVTSSHECAELTRGLKMLRRMCFHAISLVVFAVSLDAFHVGLLTTTTTTHRIHQAPKTLMPNRLMPIRLMARRAFNCFSMQSVSVIVSIYINCLIMTCGVHVFCVFSIDLFSCFSG